MLFRSVMERGVLVVVRVGTRGQWWRRHAKGVEQGALVIVCVGTRQRWRGAGRRLSIVVVVGAHGWHWVVVAVNGAGGACAWRRGRRSWVFVAVRVVVGRLWVEAWALLIACDHLLAGVLLSVWSWSWFVVGAVTGGVGGLVGDMALPGLGPGGLLSWVTRMVVVEASLLPWAPR